MKIIARAEAKALGLKRYFTGKPCLHGHISERFVSSQGCCECNKERWPAYSIKNRSTLTAKARARYAVAPEKGQERAKDYRALNPQYVKRNNEKWARENPKRRSEINAAWRARNKQYLSDRQKLWRINNPERAKEVTRNARAKRRAALGSHTQDDIADILRLQRKRCAIPTCRANLANGYHVDHIIALACGGSNDRRNLQALCPTCNVRKGTKDPIDFAQELGLL